MYIIVNINSAVQHWLRHLNSAYNRLNKHSPSSSLLLGCFSAYFQICNRKCASYKRNDSWFNTGFFTAVLVLNHLMKYIKWPNPRTLWFLINCFRRTNKLLKLSFKYSPPKIPDLELEYSPSKVIIRNMVPTYKHSTKPVTTSKNLTAHRHTDQAHTV